MRRCLNILICFVCTRVSFYKRFLALYSPLLSKQRSNSCNYFSILCCKLVSKVLLKFTLHFLSESFIYSLSVVTIFKAKNFKLSNLSTS